MVSVRVLIFLASLDNVEVAPSVSVSILTNPRILVAVPAPIVIDSGDGGARFLVVRRDNVSSDDMVSVIDRILILVFVTVDDMVMVSVRVLTTLLTPELSNVSASIIEIV